MKLKPLVTIERLRQVLRYDPHRKWRAEIRLNKKGKFLGYFDDIELGYQAYCAAAVEHHGEFARIS
jgi:hypothetical protein